MALIPKNVHVTLRAVAQSPSTAMAPTQDIWETVSPHPETPVFVFLRLLFECVWSALALSTVCCSAVACNDEFCGRALQLQVI